MLASCGPSSHRVFFPRSSVASGRTTVHWVTSFVLKRFLETPELKKKRFSYHLWGSTTQCGSMAFWWTSGILVSDAKFFRVSYQSIFLRLEWVPICRSCTSRRWGSHKVASCPQPCSALRLKTVKAVLKGMDCSLFVDYFALCVSGKTLNRVERAMHLCLNSVQEWVSENGF